MIKPFEECYIYISQNEARRAKATKRARDTYNKWYDVAVEIDSGMKTSNKSLAQFCSELGCAYANLYKFFKRYSTTDIHSRHNGTRERDIIGASKRTKHNLNKQEVENMYLTQMKSLGQIASILNCDKVTVFKFCKSNNIPLRTCSEGTKLHRRQLSPQERETRKKIDVERGIKNYLNRRMHGTKPELHFKQWLETNNISFTEQYRKVGNGHPYDFFLSERNLIVEIDGNYWHSKKEQRIKDIRFTQDAIDKGYDIIRINTKDVDYKQSDYSKWI